MAGNQQPQQHYRSPFGDTTLTKVFVGGLAWETPTDVMHTYFQQFGEILEAVIISDKLTGKSKGYGFVTFRGPESARRACIEANPVIDGRRANCNIASLGRPRTSPPSGRNQVGNIYQGGSGIGQGGARPYTPFTPPPVPTTPQVMYQPYGYTGYTSADHYAYQQTIYSAHVQQAQYYNQLYSPGTSSSTMGSPYYYGYSLHTPRGTYPTQRFQGTPYLYYPPQPIPPLLQQPRLPNFPSSTDSIAPIQTSTETEAGPATSTSSTA